MARTPGPERRPRGAEEWNPAQVEQRFLNTLQADFGLRMEDVAAMGEAANQMSNELLVGLVRSRGADRARLLQDWGFDPRGFIDESENRYDKSRLVYERRRSGRTDQLRVQLKNGDVQEPEFFNSELSTTWMDGDEQHEQTINMQRATIRLARTDRGRRLLNRGDILHREAEFSFGGHGKRGLEFARRDVVLDDQEPEPGHRVRALAQTQFDERYSDGPQVHRTMRAETFDLRGGHPGVPSRFLTRTEDDSGNTYLVEKDGPGTSFGPPYTYEREKVWTENNRGGRRLEAVHDGRQRGLGLHYKRSGVSFAEGLGNLVTAKGWRLTERYGISEDLDSYLDSVAP